MVSSMKTHIHREYEDTYIDCAREELIFCPFPISYISYIYIYIHTQREREREREKERLFVCVFVRVFLFMYKSKMQIHMCILYTFTRANGIGLQQLC